MMAKFEKLAGTKGQYSFWCPGCQCTHYVWTKNEGYPHPVWGFNGGTEKPTITPSIKVEYPTEDQVEICHSFIRDGRIEYLSDCTHSLAGKTVDMLDINEV